MRTALLLLLLAAPARADEQPSPAPHAWPRVGGHFGLALPIAAFDNSGTTVIGRDFAQVGVTPGVTVKIDEHWSVDFEFIAFSRWDLNSSAQNRSHTILVVDPGVVYGFGPVAVGLRLAMQIGEAVPLNFGIVPIVVVPFKISKKVSYFLELDLPVFVFGVAGAPATATTAATDSHAVGNLTILFQTGFAF